MALVDLVSRLAQVPPNDSTGNLGGTEKTEGKQCGSPGSPSSPETCAAPTQPEVDVPEACRIPEAMVRQASEGLMAPETLRQILGDAVLQDLEYPDAPVEEVLRCFAQTVVNRWALSAVLPDEVEHQKRTAAESAENTWPQEETDPDRWWDDAQGWAP